jgi:hypothetical protein
MEPNNVDCLLSLGVNEVHVHHDQNLVWHGWIDFFRCTSNAHPTPSCTTITCTIWSSITSITMAGTVYIMTCARADCAIITLNIFILFDLIDKFDPFIPFWWIKSCLSLAKVGVTNYFIGLFLHSSMTPCSYTSDVNIVLGRRVSLLGEFIQCWRCIGSSSFHSHLTIIIWAYCCNFCPFIIILESHVFS